MRELKLAIVGSGPAGYTAALYGARAGLAPTVFTGDRPGGMLAEATRIENYPAFTASQSGAELIDTIRRQAEHFGATDEYGRISRIDVAGSAGLPHRLTLADSGEIVSAEAIIIATGTRHRSLGLPGERKFLGHGLSFCAVCDAAFYAGKTVAICGSSERTVEEALLLAMRSATVHLLFHPPSLTLSPALGAALEDAQNIVLHPGCLIEELLGDGTLTGLRIRSVATGRRDTLMCDGLFAAAGVTPNTEFLLGGAIPLDSNGYIDLAAPMPSGIFAAGDCASPPRRHQAIIAAGAGAAAALDAIAYLRQKSKQVQRTDGATLCQKRSFQND